MKYIISVNNNMYFKYWHMSQYPVFVIDAIRMHMTRQNVSTL